MQNHLVILGLETSCDETGIAVYTEPEGLLAHTLYSQVIHKAYGGVVPELASRDHICKITPLCREALKRAQLKLADLRGIAYCCGPGLSGALLVGSAFARSLGWALNLPTLGVHHLEAHLLAVMLEEQHPKFPFLALLVSGGHTLLVNVQSLGFYQILGESLDDAAGEAFDKVAQILGLNYPGGAALAALAAQGNPTRFHLTRPMLDKPGFDFSFSGLKTQTNILARSLQFDTQTRADLAAAFQTAMVDTLVIKTQHALRHTGLKRLIIAGGVAANTLLRSRIRTMAHALNVCVYFPRIDFCTDNAAMIAYLGYQRMQRGELDSNLSIRTQVRWSLDALT